METIKITRVVEESGPCGPSSPCPLLARGAHSTMMHWDQVHVDKALFCAEIPCTVCNSSSAVKSFAVKEGISGGCLPKITQLRKGKLEIKLEDRDA